MSRPFPEMMINATKGPFLEGGGPTQHLTSPASIDFINKPLIVSNVGPGYVRLALWKNRLHPILDAIPALRMGVRNDQVAGRKVIQICWRGTER